MCTLDKTWGKTFSITFMFLLVQVTENYVFLFEQLVDIIS